MAGEIQNRKIEYGEVFELHRMQEELINKLAQIIYPFNISKNIQIIPVGIATTLKINNKTLIIITKSFFTSSQ